jgi:hypothetical protein
MTRHLRAVLAGLVLVALATAPASASWTDQAVVTGTSLSTANLTGVTLVCSEVTLPVLIDAAKVAWTPVTSPTTLTYSARIVQSGQAVPVDTNSSATVPPSLLGAGLFGTTVTLRVTGALPGTGWTTSNDQSLKIGPLGAYVDCPP